MEIRRHSLTVRAANQPAACDRATLQVTLWLVVLALLAGLFSSRVWGEEDPEKAKSKELEARIKADRAKAELLSEGQRALTDDQKKALRDKTKKANEALEKKQNDADYKQKVLDNLGSVKEMFAKAEESWKNQKFGEAGALYSSVAGATVSGAEELAETARGRLVEMEDLAKTHLKGADDSDLKREYVKEVEELSLINKEFALTKTREVALRRLITLKSKPEVAGYVDISQAEGLETDGKLMDAIAIYHAIANNPRYENTVPWLKARRKLEELNKNEATKTKIKAEGDAKADREAPLLLAAAKNFRANNYPKQAIEKLQAVVDKFPNSKWAEDAKKQLADLKN